MNQDLQQSSVYKVRYLAGALSLISWLVIVIGLCMAMTSMEVNDEPSMIGAVVAMMVSMFAIVAIIMVIPVLVLSVFVCLPSLKDKQAFPFIVLGFDLYMLFSLCITALTSRFSPQIWPLYVMIALLAVSIVTLLVHTNLLAKKKRIERAKQHEEERLQYEAYLKQYQNYLAMTGQNGQFTNF